MTAENANCKCMVLPFMGPVVGTTFSLSPIEFLQGLHREWCQWTKSEWPRAEPGAWHSLGPPPTVNAPQICTSNYKSQLSVGPVTIRVRCQCRLLSLHLAVVFFVNKGRGQRYQARPYHMYCLPTWPCSHRDTGSHQTNSWIALSEVSFV